MHNGYRIQDGMVLYISYYIRNAHSLWAGTLLYVMHVYNNAVHVCTVLSIHVMDTRYVVLCMHAVDVPAVQAPVQYTSMH